MMNFSSQFWNQFGMMMKENTFDKHFDNPDLKLTTLLDDDLIIGEFRNQNKNLMEFLSNEEMGELVQYITEMPTEDSNSKRAFRYPFYSCELLCCEVPKVAEAFFGDDKKLLILLFQFLTQPEEINTVLAGYVCKVLFTLCKLKSEQFYAEIFSYPEIVPGLVKHLQSRSICEVIIKLLTLERESTEDYQEQRVNLMQGILGLVNKEFEISINVAQIVHELIQRMYMIASPQQIIDVLFSNVPNLCNQITSDDNFVSLSAGSILYNILTLVYKNQLKQHDPDDNTIFQIDVDLLFEQLGQALAKWLEFLKSDTPLLGQHKLKIVEIIGVALTLNNQSFITKLDELNLCGVYNELFVKYERHDIFHLSYYRFIVHIVEQKLDVLVQNLFDRNQFVNYLLICTKELKNQTNQRKGYLGFLTKLAHFLEEYALKYELLQKYIITDEWRQFKQQYFDRAERTNNIELGGHTRYEPNEEIDVYFNKEDIEKKYSDFLTSDHKEQENIAVQLDNIYISDQQMEEEQQKVDEVENVKIEQQQQQQQQQEQEIQQEQIETIQQQNSTFQQEQNQIKEDYAEEEALDEFNRFWKLHPHENSSYHNDALYEFEKSI